MAQALLIVPPWLKYSAGPLLGPAMLCGVAHAAGHGASVLDLNARYVHSALDGVCCAAPGLFTGDHGRDDGLLRRVGQILLRDLSALLPPYAAPDPPADPTLALLHDHEAVAQAAEQLSVSEAGMWIEAEFREHPAPHLVGVSALHGGQVIWGLAATLLARRVWPEASIVWGGAHVTALRDEICQDHKYGRLIDGFIFGYAERSFVQLLDALDRHSVWPAAVHRAGEGPPSFADEDPSVVPIFDAFSPLHGEQLVLPTQLSRGCAYGRCSFCTYPSVEGHYRNLGTEGARAVVALARTRGAAVSFKDSLLVPQLLRQAGDISHGEVPWSACTKLSPALDGALCGGLAASGCRTLEIGLETLSEDAQRLIDKRQSRTLFLRVLDALADAGIAVVVNYITGFPGVPAAEEAVWIDWLKHEVGLRRGHLSAKIEHNQFQLERRAPLAAMPPPGLQITASWPWSSILGWRYAPTAFPHAPRRSPGLRLASSKA